jgi:hypothetical protein
MRNNAIAGGFLIMLCVEVVLAGGLLVSRMDSPLNAPLGLVAMRDGMVALMFLAVNTACMVFIPAYTAARLMLERSEREFDMYHVTPLMPVEIVHGKTLAAAGLAGELYCAAAPFFAMLFLLREMDVGSLAVVLTINVCSVFLNIQVGVAVGMVSGSAWKRGSAILAGMGIGAYVLGSATSWAASLRKGGGFDSFLSVVSWALVVVVAGGLFSIMLRSWAIAGMTKLVGRRRHLWQKPIMAGIIIWLIASLFTGFVFSWAVTANFVIAAIYGLIMLVFLAYLPRAVRLIKTMDAPVTHGTAEADR